MVAPLLLALVDPISKLLDKIIPDPQAAAQAKLDLIKEENATYLEQIKLVFDNDAAQSATNQEEAKASSMFVAGWRPFIGWVCGSAFVYKFILQPFLIFTLVACGSKFDYKSLPQLDWTEMMPVMTGMLGLGYMRTMEKMNNAQSKSG